MSSAYPPARLCQRCGISFSPQESYCPNCGYYHAPASGNVSAHGLSPTSGPIWGGNSAPHNNGPQYYANQQSSSAQVQNAGYPSAMSMHPLPPPQTGPAFPTNLTTPPPTGMTGYPSPQPPAALRQPGPNTSALTHQPGGYANMAAPSGQFPHTNNYRGAAQPPQAWPSMSASQQPSMQVPPQTFAPITPQSGVSFLPPSAMQRGLPPPSSSGPALNPGNHRPARRRFRARVFVGVLLLLVAFILMGLAVYALLPGVTGNTGNAPFAVATPTGTLRFTDSFQNNSKGWNLQSENSFYSMTIDHGSLTLEDDRNKLLPINIPGTVDRPLRDFTIAFDAVLSHGDPVDGYGINVRGRADQYGNFPSCYRIELYGDGSYAAFKVATDANGNVSTTRLVGYDTSSAIHKQGSSNHVVFTARGASMTLQVNGQTVKAFTDSSYTSGGAELFVANLPGAQAGAQAKFSNLSIYDL